MNIFASGRLRSFALLFTDIISLALAIFVVFFIYKQCGALYEMSIVWRTWPIFLLLTALNIIGRLYCGNLIYPGLVLNPVEELRRLTLSCIGSFLIFMAVLTLTRENIDFSRVALSFSALASAVALPLGRIVLRYLLWKFKIAYIPAVITGDAALARDVLAKLRSDNYAILSIKGSCCGEKIGENISDLPPAKFVEIARRAGINYLIYCNKEGEYSRDMDLYLSSFLHILVVNQTARFPVMWSYPVSFYRYFSFEISNRLLRKGVLMQKRILEIVLAAIGLIMAFIPGILLALLVKLSSRGPVFYKASRLGKDGVPIQVLKFRTMRVNADAELEKLLAENPELQKEWNANFKLENDPRITGIGKFLRRTSLDELPQFWNVIKGEMALIGPRPIVQDEVHYYGKDYKIFASVKPGITGLWQVSGRSDVDYEERVALDVFYVNNWSIWMDYYIFFATINAVLFRRGAK